MGNFSEALKISKHTKLDIADIISRKKKVEDIDFIRECENNDINFELSGWSEYENDFRKMLYERGNFPKMGLLKEHLDYVFDNFKKGNSVSFSVSNFKESDFNKSIKKKNTTRSSSRTERA